jgi:hypothetical protein
VRDPSLQRFATSGCGRRAQILSCLLSLFVVTHATANGAAVRFVITDSESGKPVPCRIHLKDSAGKPVRPPRLPYWSDHFVCPGVAELDLPSGAYRYEIERGPEFERANGSLTIGASDSQSVTNQVRRLVNLSREGWWSGELHVHRPIADIELLMRAEDLHVAPVITWWNDDNTWKNRALPATPLVRFDDDRFYHLMGGEDERNGGALLQLESTARHQRSRA